MSSYLNFQSRIDYFTFYLLHFNKSKYKLHEAECFEKAHCSWRHSEHDLFVFECKTYTLKLEPNCFKTQNEQKGNGRQIFSMHFPSLTGFLETTFMQKLCSVNLSHGWLVADYHKTHLYIWSSVYLSCSWPAVFIAGILCCQGNSAEIDNGLEGSDKPYAGKKSRYWPLLQSSTGALYVCTAHTHTQSHSMWYLRTLKWM